MQSTSKRVRDGEPGGVAPGAAPAGDGEGAALPAAAAAAASTSMTQQLSRQMLLAANAKLETCQAELQRVRTAAEATEDRLQKHLLAAAERLRFLNDHNDKLSAEVAALEARLATQAAEYRATIRKLESNRDKTLEEWQAAAADWDRRERELMSRIVGAERTQAASSIDAHAVDALRSEAEQLRAQVASLQAQLEHERASGAVDGTRTRVLHLAAPPPPPNARQLNERVEVLEAENAALRVELDQARAVGDGAATAGGSAADVAAFKVQLEKAQKLEQRLREVFKQKIQQFREAAYSLLGFQIDMVQQASGSGITLRLNSMYAEHPDDSLLFQNNGRGYELLETPFAAQHQLEVRSCLQERRSIPLFLAVLTQQLFERQTAVQ